MLCSLLLYGTILYTFGTAIWTFSIAVPYLALAPVHKPRLEHRLVVPTIETITMLLWLAVPIVQAYSLSSPDEDITGDSHRATQGVIILAALEWYVLETGVVSLFSSCRAKALK